MHINDDGTLNNHNRLESKVQHTFFYMKSCCKFFDTAVLLSFLYFIIDGVIEIRK